MPNTLNKVINPSNFNLQTAVHNNKLFIPFKNRNISEGNTFLFILF